MPTERSASSLKHVVTLSTTVVALVCLSFSATHAHEVALRAIQDPLAWGMVAVLDGLAFAGAARLVDDRRAGRDSSWATWAAAMLGLAGSLAANLVGTIPELASDRAVQVAVALIPPVALALLAHVGLQYLGDEHGADPSPTRPSPSPERRPVPDPAPVPLSSNGSSPPALPPPSGNGSSRPRPRPALNGEDRDALLPVAREVALQAGRPVGRDLLLKELRARGHQVGTKRATLLVAALRAEAAP